MDELNDINLVNSQQRLINDNTPDILHQAFNGIDNNIENAIQMPVASLKDKTIEENMGSINPIPAEAFTFDTPSNSINNPFNLMPTHDLNTSQAQGKTITAYTTLPFTPMAQPITFTFDGTSILRPLSTISIPQSSNQNVLSLTSNNSLPLCYSSSNDANNLNIELLSPNRSQTQFVNSLLHSSPTSTFNHSTSPNGATQGTIFKTQQNGQNFSPNNNSNSQFGAQNLITLNALNENDVTSNTLNVPSKVQTQNVSKAPTAPLGSSENPIQIVQHGDSYHSSQHLTKAQLDQILHVLQQQNKVAKPTVKGGKAIIFNPTTNTRIVYRVIYPSDVAKRSESVTKGRGRGRPRRKGIDPLKTQSSTEVEPSRDEDRELKKRLTPRPRTRSGRVSKPPTYMVKDYKRINYFDYEEEGSEGGYSDYEQTEEDISPQDHIINTSLLSKPKKFKCQICDKAYIGSGGLFRHLKLNPSHKCDMNTELLKDSSQDRVGLNEDTNEATSTQENIPPGLCIGKKRKSTHISEFHSNRRKMKLKEILAQCRDDEIIDIVLPKLVELVSPWGFFLSKSSSGTEPFITQIMRNFEKLLEDVQQFAKECFSLDNETDRDISATYVTIENESLATCLNLSKGSYKFSNPLPNGSIYESCNAEEREVEVIDLEPPRKQPRAETEDLSPASLDPSSSSIDLLPSFNPTISSTTDIIHTNHPQAINISNETGLQNENALIPEMMEENISKHKMLDIFCSSNAPSKQTYSSEDSNLMPSSSSNLDTLMLETPQNQELIASQQESNNDQVPSTGGEELQEGSVPLILSNGQIIGLWYDGQVTLDPTYLANNVVIMENVDGTFHVPNEQTTIPFEALQTLLSIDQNPLPS